MERENLFDNLKQYNHTWIMHLQSSRITQERLKTYFHCGPLTRHTLVRHITHNKTKRQDDIVIAWGIYIQTFIFNCSIMSQLLIFFLNEVMVGLALSCCGRLFHSTVPVYKNRVSGSGVVLVDISNIGAIILIGT